MALPSRLFCDTSFFYACLDPNDTNHDRAEELTADAAASAAAFFTTWDIVSETITLFRYRMGFRPALRFLEEIKPHLTIIECDPKFGMKLSAFSASVAVSVASRSVTRFHLLSSRRFWTISRAWLSIEIFARWV